MLVVLDPYSTVDGAPDVINNHHKEERRWQGPSALEEKVKRSSVGRRLGAPYAAHYVDGHQQYAVQLRNHALVGASAG